MKGWGKVGCKRVKTNVKEKTRNAAGKTKTLERFAQLREVRPPNLTTSSDSKIIPFHNYVLFVGSPDSNENQKEKKKTIQLNLNQFLRM